MKERLIELFEAHFGDRPDVILDLAADGSTRQYFRLIRGEEQTAIGAIGPDREENRAFISFARQFDHPDGQVYAFFIMTLAAAEAAVGLAIVIALFRLRESTDVDELSLLKW